MYFVARILGPFNNFEAVHCYTAFLYRYPKLNCSDLFYSYTYVYTSVEINETSMLIWENNPLTLKFLVTSFGIAVSLYTSFSEIGLYTFKRILTLLLFISFFPICVFFCLLHFLNIVHQ